MKRFLVWALLFASITRLSAFAEIQFVSAASEYERIPTADETVLLIPNFDAGTSPDTTLLIGVATKQDLRPAKKQKISVDDPILSVTFDGKPVPLITTHVVKNTFSAGVYLFSIPAQGCGDIAATYQIKPSSKYDAISICAVSYSGVASLGAISQGSKDEGVTKTLSDAMTTTANESVIVSTLQGSGHGVGTLTGIDSTTIRVNNAVDGLTGGFLELRAPTADAYSLGALFPEQFRAVMVSAELLAQ